MEKHTVLSGQYELTEDSELIQNEGLTELLDAGKYKQLFLDDHAIESSSGIVRSLHQPYRYGPVLKPHRAQQQTLVQSSSVPQWNAEKDLWEWWYLAFYDSAPYQGPGAAAQWGDIHYATSLDGIEWERPSLGLYDWRGSRNNNLAYHSKIDFLRRRGMRNPVDIGERRLHHVIRDERDPDPQRRYKSFASNGDNQRRYPAFSPDGFHWTFPHVPGIPSEDTSQLLYDDFNERFAATVKQRTEWGRSVWLSTSQDFVEWTDPVLVLHTDEIDQANRRERIRRVVEDPDYLSPPHIDEETDFIAQLYQMPVMSYEGQYIGFPLLFNPAGLDLPQMNNVGLNQTELAVSRDLYHWNRVGNREIFLGIEPWDGINYGTCQVSVCGPPIVRDDEIWIFYGACRFRGVPASYPPEYAEYFNDMGALELAKLRLDGFVSMDAAGDGTILTKPMELSGQELYINTEAQNGEIRVAIVNSETMAPLSGYALSDCHPVHGDRLAGRVNWPKGTLTAAHPVRLRFELTNAKLYSFWLAS